MFMTENRKNDARFGGSFLLFMFRACHIFLSVHGSLVFTCWERADLLALLYVMFNCVFVTFPCGVLGQMWCLIVSIHDLCLLSYFVIVQRIKHKLRISYQAPQSGPLLAHKGNAIQMAFRW